ncbi:hypothetical protein L1285_00315 [Pseudoalteromonas sp. DL2-H2.2]|uniref:hypothetical protein n=1 Tax=Pseudoalteromonas sp. DL2-H2.2 TaxID=2908889 RepID=UPI001F27527C|nr:hypothetical protein [Pseudoalteromonas sp. DL2-H2.2]MCF2906782.1 hypothetical protein [Pseudoalteromonas sp. DL2-H2.2]
MFKYSKIAIGLATCFALSGCLEVEDNNNNDELVNKLEQQNQILQSQLDENKKQSEAQAAKDKALETPFILKGGIVAAVDGVDLSDVQVTAYYDGTWHEPVDVAEDGSYSIPKVPQYSNILLKVSSPSNAIVTQLFDHATRSAGDRTEVVSAVQTLTVSKPHTVTFSILNRNTFEAISDLQITAEPELSFNTYTSARYELAHMLEKNKVDATYSTETNQYELIVPQGIDFKLAIDVDVDNDGNDEYTIYKSDYEIHSSNGIANLHHFDAERHNTLHATVESINEYDLMVNFVGASGEQLYPDTVFAINNDKGDSNFTFNEAQGHYTLSARYYGELQFITHEFTVNGRTYKADNIGIYRDHDDTFQISRHHSQNHQEGLYNSELSNNTLAITIPLVEQVSAPYLGLEIIESTEDEVEETHGLTYYFNAPVSLKQDSARLYKQGVITVVKGNDSDSDDVAAGTTSIQRANQSVELNRALSFNDTKLSIAPAAPLEAGYTYRYELDNITRKEANSQGYVNRSVQFSIDTPFEFDESQFKADNMNYRSGGALITPKNTAGEQSGTNSDAASYQLCIIAPKDVMLSDAHISAVTTNGVKYTTDQRYHGYSNVYLYALADNEQLDSNIYLNMRSAQPNGYYHSICFDYISQYDQDGNWAGNAQFMDHTDSATNSVDVNITYRLPGSDTEISTGVKTLYID